MLFVSYIFLGGVVYFMPFGGEYLGQDSSMSRNLTSDGRGWSWTGAREGEVV